MICASLTEKTVSGMIKAGNKTKADLVEVRLDFLQDFNNLGRLALIRKPIIATCMPKWEGGRFKGTERQRIKLLEETLGFAGYLTIELKARQSDRDGLTKKARKRKVKVIVACHDFKKTPSKKDIASVIKKELSIGDFAKIACMPKSMADVLNLVSVLSESKNKSRIIALSMGKLGRVSRIICPLLGSFLTYGSVSKGKEAGPGQLTVDELRQIFTALSR
ncbi:MAG: type I 3-dehydroquinate dehydratase [Candidatus Altiarchaeales archaeon]|nr:type I 3-dehydroquinate dehydratase [Candidatus Altiarchaeales archaeon]